MDIFSERLKKLREERNLMQGDIAPLLNISRSSYSNYENGHTPPVDVIISCANFFDVSSDYLLGLSTDKRPAAGALGKKFVSLSQLSQRDDLTAGDVGTLLDALDTYYRASAPAGHAPLEAVRDFLHTMPQLLAALSRNDTAGTLEGVNNAASVALSINRILVDYLAKK